MKNTFKASVAAAGQGKTKEKAVNSPAEVTRRGTDCFLKSVSSQTEMLLIYNDFRSEERRVGKEC